MTLQRIKHWQTRTYHDFLASSMSKPFAWGRHDCCLFCADGIQAQTGVDIASDFRGKYHDESSAFALIKSVTGGMTVADAAAYCATKHGMAELEHPLTAQRGDLVVIDNEGRLIAGLVHTVMQSTKPSSVQTVITTISARLSTAKPDMGLRLSVMSLAD